MNFSFSPLSNYAKSLTSIKRVNTQLLIDDNNIGEPNYSPSMVSISYNSFNKLIYSLFVTF